MFVSCWKYIDNAWWNWITCAPVHQLNDYVCWKMLLNLIILGQPWYTLNGQPWLSGILTVWGRGTSVHVSRSLWGCNALPLHWSLVLLYKIRYHSSLVGLPAFLTWSGNPCRYVEVNMDSAAIVWPLFNSLQAFWPGLQVSVYFLKTRMDYL